VKSFSNITRSDNAKTRGNYMTTPQGVLISLEYNTRSLMKMLNGSYDEDEESQDIYERVKAIQADIKGLTVNMERIEDQMALIIKVLCKNEKDA
jgi:hypothetical protein